jgi:hypothetical protein
MMNPYAYNYSHAFVPGFFAGWFSVLVIPLTIWSVAWMGLALWKAARNGDKAWFVILLLVHTLGILDILYIYLFSKQEPSKVKTSNRKQK